MSRLLSVHLPVQDVERSVAFFSGLGFVCGQPLDDGRASCLVVNDQALVMLLVRSFFDTFTTGSSVQGATEVVLGVSAASRDDVDRLVDRAVELGGTVAGAPSDGGFMYGRSFQDLDGHAWEVIWMDPATG